jgi:hypothetical protein
MYGEAPSTSSIWINQALLEPREEYKYPTHSSSHSFAPGQGKLNNYNKNYYKFQVFAPAK